MEEITNKLEMNCSHLLYKPPLTRRMSPQVNGKPLRRINPMEKPIFTNVKHKFRLLQPLVLLLRS